MSEDRNAADGVSRRLVLHALGVATGGRLLSGIAAGTPEGQTARDSGAAATIRGDDAAAATPRHVLPGARGTAQASLPTFEQCIYPIQEKSSLYGPTRMNATTGNQGMSVGIAGDGSVTVLRWPRPSFFDQIKHYATDRSRPRMGAAPNEGSFLGVRVTTPDGERTEWLRDWATEQRYEHEDTDTVVTQHRSDDLGLTVTVRDVVARRDDALLREAMVSRDDDSSVEALRLVGFANVNPVVTKVPRLPVTDWCLEEAQPDTTRYDSVADAVVYRGTGVDDSSGEHRSVAIAVGFDRASDGHHVGADAYAHPASVLGQQGPFRDAYDDASDGPLSGNDRFAAQSTTALAVEVDPDGGTATFLVTAGETAEAATETLVRYRELDPASVRAEKRAWYEDLFGDGPMPDCDDEAVVALAKRALVSLAQAFDPETGAIVASIATQSPYAEDWPRDGAYFNYLLSALGFHEWVAHTTGSTPGHSRAAPMRTRTC